MTKYKKSIILSPVFLGGFTQNRDDRSNLLIAFLRKANLNSYANENTVQSPPLRPGWTHYHYESTGTPIFVYDDEYCGNSPFLGQEVVSQNGKPIWGMNYFGGTTGTDVDGKAVYAFLRSALMIEARITDVDLHEVRNEPILPVRGPKLFAEGEWTYRFDAEGDIMAFWGDEAILLENRVVYRAHVHGGFI